MLSLEPEHLAIVGEVLEKFLPDYEVWAFGSRVGGRVKKYSDLDLVVSTSGPLGFGPLEAKDALSESDLPFKVDLLDWSELSESFRGIVLDKHFVLQRRVKYEAHT